VISVTALTLLAPFGIEARAIGAETLKRKIING